jgi:hypothetical protein
MTDPHAGATFQRPGNPPVGQAADSSEFDRELNIPLILWTTVGVIVITVLSAAAMWGMLKGFVAFDSRHAEAPPPMSKVGGAAAPEPSLQAAPTADMQTLHRDEDRLLEHAGWVDRAQGTVRLPIDVAIDVLAARGLPRVATPSLADMAAHGSYANDGRPPADQPSPGTLLPPPGSGISNIGPPSAGAGQQFGAAQPGPPVPMGGAAGTRTAAPAPPPAARQPGAERPPRTPVLPPPPPGGRP